MTDERKSVPREPTQEMLRACDDMAEDKYVARGRAYDAWTRMFDAAPSPAAPQWRPDDRTLREVATRELARVDLSALAGDCVDRYENCPSSTARWSAAVISGAVPKSISATNAPIVPGKTDHFTLPSSRSRSMIGAPMPAPTMTRGTSFGSHPN